MIYSKEGGKKKKILIGCNITRTIFNINCEMNSQTNDLLSECMYVRVCVCVCICVKWKKSNVIVLPNIR